MKNKKKIRKLENRLMVLLSGLHSQATMPAQRYRLTAEMEDIETGTWDGARTDDPPESWLATWGYMPATEAVSIAEARVAAMKEREAQKDIVSWGATISQAAAEQLVELSGEEYGTCKECGLDLPGRHPH